MLIAAAVCPHPPLLIPEATGGSGPGEEELERLRTTCQEAVAALRGATADVIVVAGGADMGIVLGGSGQGEAISANKVHGVRAALCHDETTARLARNHNNANVLALGARFVAPELALTILDVFLAASFEGGRHVPRLAKIAAIETEECG